MAKNIWIPLYGQTGYIKRTHVTSIYLTNAYAVQQASGNDLRDDEGMRVMGWTVVAEARGETYLISQAFLNKIDAIDVMEHIIK